MKITDEMPALTPKVKRLTPDMMAEIRSLKIGEGVQYSDARTATAAEAYARRKGWRCVRRKSPEGDVFKFWRAS